MFGYGEKPERVHREGIRGVGEEKEGQEGVQLGVGHQRLQGCQKLALA